MGAKTKIEWTDATWNPVTGCTPVSPGCAHCYARRMAKRLAGRCGYPEAPHEFDVTPHPEKLDEPLHWKNPHRVFVCSMSDLFHDDVERKFIHKVFDVMINSPAHTFQLLTKRPERMLEVTMDYFYLRKIRHLDRTKPTENIWLGVTAENQEQANKRIPLLLQIPAAARFVSVEPMLGAVDLQRIKKDDYDMNALDGFWMKRPYMPGDNGESEPSDCGQSGHVDWVICGGETGPNARPMHPDWARSLRDQCVAAGIPFFYKGAGTATIPKSDPEYMLLDGVEWKQFPEVTQ